MIQQILRAAILNPKRTGRVRFIRDGVIASDISGRIVFVGEWAELEKAAPDHPPARRLDGIVTPPFLDAHIHIPQFPVRGKFAEGVEELADGGRLLAGLQRNVFPAEAMCADPGYARECVRQFQQDTLARGVVGGAAYMTVHAEATEIALRELGPAWSVGMVLMNQNCPEYLRTSDPRKVVEDIRRLAKQFGHRLIVTDRFAVAVDSRLRLTAARLAGEAGLRTQTHLNEQKSEKKFVEQTLYPDYASYTDVYFRDGLLNFSAILAHCIWMRDDEWSLVRDTGSAIAHCPTSNSLLGSGVMNLEEVQQRKIPYSICTDVGASPTTSILCEMAEFLRAHDGLHPSATAEEALYRSTLAPAEILGLDGELGSFEPGKPLSFIEIESTGPIDANSSAEQVIRRNLLELSDGDGSAHAELRRKLASEGLHSPAEMDALSEDVRKSISRLDGKILQVTLAGSQVFRRQSPQ